MGQRNQAGAVPVRARCQGGSLVFGGHALVAAVVLAGCAKGPVQPIEMGPELPKRELVTEMIHGVEVADPYRWMEEESPERQSFIDTNNAEFQAASETPQQAWLYERYQALWRYDYESAPSLCEKSEGVFVRAKRADEDKTRIIFKPRADGEGRVILDPNQWEETETLAGFTPSPDCSLAVFGKARAGDEKPVLYVLDLVSGETREDTLRGWMQRGVEWFPDSSAFYYMAKPLEGEVPEGEHEYWQRSWKHTIGTSADADELIFSDDEVKEHWHYVAFSDDGTHEFRMRGKYYGNKLWIREAGAEDWTLVTDDDSGDNWPLLSGDQLFVHTNRGADNGRILVADVAAPTELTEFIAESDDPLEAVALIDSTLYLTYKHNVASKVVRYDLDGTLLGEVPLPGLGSASVQGFVGHDEVRVTYESYAFPDTVYRYEPDSNELVVVKASAVPMEQEVIDRIEMEQVWYPSADGTKVSMWVLGPKGAPRDGSVPTVLYGYGGFQVSMDPGFSVTWANIVTAGGRVAIANLRGGGEYGEAWHEAGMLDKKQNVFDDFIAAAEYLVAEGYTRPQRLGIAGGSNGGLLVSATLSQRPELFAAGLCSVPLTDMIRYHKFGFANVWSAEYGSSEDPEQFKTLLAYSPVHNLKTGVDYPALLTVGSLNDARTSPLHAFKFHAAYEHADLDHGQVQPIVLHTQADSGHHGAVTIDVKADQSSRHYGWLMAQIGLSAPPSSD